jgi:RNA polymerase sigma-70 factor (sigma-E family)
VKGVAPAVLFTHEGSGKGIGARERVAGVSQREFTEFYRSGRDACLRAVLAAVGERALAEDLVAEAFARAWASWPTVRRHPAPRAWVVRTALNTRVSWWRRRRRETGLAVVPDDTAAGPAEDHELDPALLAVLRGLPRRQREVVVLRVFLDLDTRTTAAALGIAEGTVSAHLSRAVATVRGHLVPEDTLEVGP